MSRFNKTTAALLLAAALTNLIVLGVVIPLVAVNTAAPKAAGSAQMVVTVKDADSGAAIENATVCVVEASLYFQTGGDGKTGTMDVPVLRNTNFDTALKRGFGEVTLLVYKDGYIDYILFYCMVKENTKRSAEITLYKRFSEDDMSHHTIIESPDEKWVDELINKYKK